MEIGDSNFPRFVLPTFDLSVLGSYYASGASLRESTLAASFAANGAGAGPAAITPWQLPRPQRSDDEKFADAFSNKPLFDREDPFVSLAGDNETFEDLFTLYQGLSALRDLAGLAETSPEAEGKRNLLDARLKNYLAEVEGFVDDLSFEEIELISGIAEPVMTSAIGVPKLTEQIVPFHKASIVSSVREDPIAGLSGTETFDIEVDQGGTITTVNIDLSQVSGALNLDNIADYINSQLIANGVISSFAVERHSEDEYGFNLSISANETLTFKPASGSEAVYLVGGSGNSDFAAGFLIKFDDLSAAGPAQVFRAETDTELADKANAVAVDSVGNVYIVGTTAGDLDGMVNQGSDDAYLRKYDASGALIYSRLLGSASLASGFAVAVDSGDNVIVAGQTVDPLTGTAFGGGYDTFVTKFDSDGRELFTRQAQPFADDSGLSVSVDASDNIYIAGTVTGAIGAGVSHAGGADAYVTKIDGDGALVFNKQFGGIGSDRATAVAIDDSGNIFVAAEVAGNAVLRKYDNSGASQTPTYEVDLGAYGAGGGVSGLAIGSDGNLYLAGNASAANTLSGSVIAAHSGGTDGFVTRLADNGAGASTVFTTFVGSSADDAVRGIDVKAASGADEVYLVGDTDGDLDGTGTPAAREAFLAKLNFAGGFVYASQFGSGFGHTGAGIAFDADGTTVISRLGLPGDEIPREPPPEMINLTSVRPGQSFSISVNGAPARNILIEADESFGFLTFRMNQILGNTGIAKLEKEIEDRRLTIEALNGNRIDILAGPEGFDALPGLGLRVGTLFGEPSAVEAEEKQDSLYELGLFASMSLASQQQAAEAGIVLDNALRIVRNAFRFIETGSADAPKLPQISPADQAKIANLQAILGRVSAIAQSGTNFLNTLA